jgi:hypothetical protein
MDIVFSCPGAKDKPTEPASEGVTLWSLFHLQNIPWSCIPQGFGVACAQLIPAMVLGQQYLTVFSKSLFG